MKFDGSLEEDCMETSVPQSLIQLVSMMIEHSTDIEAQIETKTTKSDLPISHLIQYNCYQSPKKRPSMLQKHSKVVKQHLSYMLACCCLQKQGSIS